MGIVIDEKKYGRLLTKVLPRPIQTDEENERYVAMLHKFEDKVESGEEISAEEQQLAEIITLLVADYEERAYPMGTKDPLVVLKHLMEANELKAIDLVDVFGSRGYVSDVLSGRRRISRDKAKKLAERFAVQPELFF